MKDQTKSKRWFRFSPLPGRKRDYYLLILAALDIALSQITQLFDVVLGRDGKVIALWFDIVVLTLWGLDLVFRTLQQKNRIAYLKQHWYEVLGFLPFQMTRFLLLVRGVKLAIVYYKIGRSDEILTQSLTREITFRFRDVIVDTIADAVFLQSLTRVEEVMSRLNYADLARKAFKNHQSNLNAAVKTSLMNKSMMGELARIPFMQGFVERTGEDVSIVISEILENEVSGEIMKEIIRDILSEMYEKVRRLDVERITGEPNQTDSN